MTDPAAMQEYFMKQVTKGEEALAAGKKMIYFVYSLLINYNFVCRRCGKVRKSFIAGYPRFWQSNPAAPNVSRRITSASIQALDATPSNRSFRTSTSKQFAPLSVL